MAEDRPPEARNLPGAAPSSGRRARDGARGRAGAAAQDGPLAFAEPWQAQLHALTLALHEGGAFAWAEWTRALGARLGAAGAAPDGSDHHALWLAALVDLLDAKGIAAREEVERVALAWQRAARATPHGTPLALDRDPERGGPGAR